MFNQPVATSGLLDPANIAEGSGRGADKELTHFLQIALGSANELEFHLSLTHDLHYLETATHQQLETHILEIQRMIAGLSSISEIKLKTTIAVADVGVLRAA